MASGKRQPSKQKRTSQNRQQRSALQARKAAASTPRSGSASGSGGSSGSRGAGGGLLGRLRGAVAPSAPRPTASSGGTGRGAARRPAGSRGEQPIGYRAALTGLIGAAAAVAVSFIVSTPVTVDGDPYDAERVVSEWSVTALKAAVDAPDADADQIQDDIDVWMPDRESEKLAIAAFPASLAMVLPVIGAYVAFRAVQQRRGSKVVNRAMYATLFGAVLTFGLLTFFLPTVIAVGVAGFQVRKAEAQAAMAEAAAAQGDDDGDVIEAEVVDDDELADDDAGDDDAEVVDDDER
jgi:hypothetical protein